VWVLAGRAGVGKHLLALGVARAAALRNRLPVRWLTTWEPSLLRQLLLAAEARVVHAALVNGILNGEEQARLDRAVRDLDLAPLAINAWTAPYAILRDAILAAEQDIVRVVVMHGDPITGDPALLAALKTCAQATGIWALLVARDLGDDREATRHAVLQHADVCIWVEREDQDEPDSPRVGEADLWVMRPGRRGVIRTVAYQPQYSRFVDCTC
jgi:replicative DNA helicase